MFQAKIGGYIGGKLYTAHTGTMTIPKKPEYTMFKMKEQYQKLKVWTRFNPQPGIESTSQQGLKPQQ